MASNKSDVFSSLSEVRALLAQGSYRDLAKQFSKKDPAHRATLLSLTADERKTLFGHARWRDIAEGLADTLLDEEHFADALKLYDALIEQRTVTSDVSGAALYGLGKFGAGARGTDVAGGALPGGLSSCRLRGAASLRECGRRARQAA